MTIRSIMLESTIQISREHVTAELARKIYDRLKDVIERTKDEKDEERLRFKALKPFDNLCDAIEYFGMMPLFGEEGDLEFLDYIDGHPLQMILLEELAPYVTPGGVLTLLDEGTCQTLRDLQTPDSNGVNQWLFDNGKVYWRPCIILGIITKPEDEDNKAAGRPPAFGPRYCSDDCMEITIGGPSAKCARCDGVPNE